VSDLPVSSDVDSLLQSPTKADFRIRLGLGSAALVSTSTFVAASAVTTTVRSSGSADDTKVPTEKAVRDALTTTSSSITQIYTELPSTGLTLGTRVWLIGQEDPADNGLYELENVSSTPTWVQKQHFMGEATTFSNTVPDVSSAQAGDQVYITAGTFWGMILEKQDDAWRYRGQFLEPKKGSIYNSTQRGQIGSYLESGELFWYALTAVDGEGLTCLVGGKDGTEMGEINTGTAGIEGVGGDGIGVLFVTMKAGDILSYNRYHGQLTFYRYAHKHQHNSLYEDQN
jgi:hypothetical protein